MPKDARISASIRDPGQDVEQRIAGDRRLSLARVEAELGFRRPFRLLYLIDAMRQGPWKSHCYFAFKGWLGNAEERKPGKVIFFACSPGQASRWSERHNTSYFFEAVTLGWKGAADTNNDRAVDLPELVRFVTVKVHEDSHFDHDQLGQAPAAFFFTRPPLARLGIEQMG